MNISPLQPAHSFPHSHLYSSSSSSHPFPVPAASSLSPNTEPALRNTPASSASMSIPLPLPLSTAHIPSPIAMPSSFSRQEQPLASNSPSSVMLPFARPMASQATQMGMSADPFATPFASSPLSTSLQFSASPFPTSPPIIVNNIRPRDSKSTKSSNSRSSLPLSPSSPSPRSSSSSSSSSSSRSSHSRDYLDDLFSRRKREAFKYDPQTRQRRKLESHRKYDHKRRFVLHSIFKDLREMIFNSEHLAKKSKLALHKDKDKAHDNDKPMHTESRQNNGKTTDQHENEQSVATEEGFPTMKELEDFSHAELFDAAANAIKRLNELKEKLEDKLSRSDSEMVTDDRSESNDQLIPLDDSAASMLSGLDVRGLASDDERHIRFLISAVDEASRKYSEQRRRFELLVQSGPRVITPTGEYMPTYAAFGMSGIHFNSVVRSSVIQANLPANELLAHWEGDVFAGVHRPQILQLYSICGLLAKNFSLSYQQRAATSPAPNVLNQFIHQAFHSPRPASSAANAAPSPSFSSSPASSSPSQLSSDEESHPLANFSIPPHAFQVARDVLNWLASLDEDEYDRQMDRLRHMARSHSYSIIPVDSIRIPSTRRIAAVDKERSALDFIWHDYWKITHAQIKAFAALFNGESIVSCPGLTVLSPTDRVLQVDVDFSLLHHPTSGNAMGIIMFLRRMYLGKKFTEIDAEETAQGGNLPTPIQRNWQNSPDPDPQPLPPLPPPPLLSDLTQPESVSSGSSSLPAASIFASGVEDVSDLSLPTSTAPVCSLCGADDDSAKSSWTAKTDAESYMDSSPTPPLSLSIAASQHFDSMSGYLPSRSLSDGMTTSGTDFDFSSSSLHPSDTISTTSNFPSATFALPPVDGSAFSAASASASASASEFVPESAFSPRLADSQAEQRLNSAFSPIH